jgi:hypothetical protein
MECNKLLTQLTVFGLAVSTSDASVLKSLMRKLDAQNLYLCSNHYGLGNKIPTGHGYLLA